MKLHHWQALMRAAGVDKLADVPQAAVDKAEKAAKALKAAHDEALKRAEKLLQKRTGRPS